MNYDIITKMYNYIHELNWRYLFTAIFLIFCWNLGFKLGSYKKKKKYLSDKKYIKHCYNQKNYNEITKK